MATTTKKKEEYPNTLAGAYSYQPQDAGSQEGIKQLNEYKNLVNQKTSALSSLGQANKQALKYADTTALAQGYATQGAALQNVGNLQNAYMNQVGGINQQYQQQLGSLKDTASQNSLAEYYNGLANIETNASLTNEQKAAEIAKLKDLSYKYLSPADLEKAQYETERLAQAYTNNEFKNTYGISSEDSGVDAEYLKSLKYGSSTSTVFGKKHGSLADMSGLQYLINNNMLKNGDVILLDKNNVVYIDGKFYKAAKNLKPNYTAKDYWQKQ